MSHHGTWHKSLTNAGSVGWLLGLIMTAFYIVIYWWPQWLNPLYRWLDPLSLALRGETTPWWFFYSTLYTFLVLVMGIKVLYKYRHVRYQQIRTLSVMLMQFFMAYLIPNILVGFRQPEMYLNYSWPLSYKDLWPDQWLGLWQGGGLGPVLAIYGLIFTFILIPVLTYFYGKRWYCSWVCGCGGLANTLGDPWRQLSDKSETAWKIEKVSIYSVLVIIVVLTGMLWVCWIFEYTPAWVQGLAKAYGFGIGMVFSGVIGVGFYPIFGTRVWCRFGCPQAAILGMLQRWFSRFRITTNGGQCISCGNCSTYCEMGIDVRAYAQKGENIVRASCVGCGICSEVCPRGVLNLENGPTHHGRY